LWLLLNLELRPDSALFVAQTSVALSDRAPPLETFWTAPTSPTPATDEAATDERPD
jgi:hypothetical protein